LEKFHVLNHAGNSRKVKKVMGMMQPSGVFGVFGETVCREFDVLSGLEIKGGEWHLVARPVSRPTAKHPLPSGTASQLAPDLQFCMRVRWHSLSLCA
jgi:hypothetical protein